MSAARPILIVEDDDALRAVLADQVALGGLFQPTEAATLAEASHHLAAPDARFDVIILDITMPSANFVQWRNFNP
jgi:DNA-binding NtrC family response regulator